MMSRAVALYASRSETEDALNRLRAELRGKYRGVFARRQVDASEAFWELFGPTSFTDGEHRIIRNPRSAAPELDEVEADAFVAGFQAVFSSKSGLYLSDAARKRLHAFRDFVMVLKEHASARKAGGPPGEGKATLLPEEVARFRKLRTAARLALRDQVGGKDLTVAADAMRGDPGDR